MDWLITLALLAYPRDFRRRFGDEMRAAVHHAAGAPGGGATVRALLALGTLVVSGIGERATAVRHALWTSPARPYLNGRTHAAHAGSAGSPSRPLAGGVTDRSTFAVGYGGHVGARPSRAALREALVADIRHAIRFARRTPFVTGLAVLALALGIGATTAVYSAIDAVFLRPLPFRQPQQLVALSVGVPFDHNAVSDKAWLDFTDLVAMPDTFAQHAAFAAGAMNLGTGAEPLRVEVTFVTTGFFALLGHDAAVGRVFTPGETSPGGPRVAVLSARLWRNQFGEEPDILGTTVTLNDVPYEIVGVMPEAFRFPSGAQVWVPLPVPVPIDLVHEAFRNTLPNVVIARLASGVTIDSARERLDVARRAYAPAGSDAERELMPATELVMPLQEWLSEGDHRTFVVLLASAVLVLLVACANVATLLLSLAATRRREMATHVVVGATRGRLVQRLIVEGLLLALIGAIASVVVAGAGLSLLDALVPRQLTGLAPMRLDLRVLTFALCVAVTTALVFSVWPALASSRVDLDEALKSTGGRSVATSSRLTRGLVVAEVALACLLVIGAGLMLASLRSLLSTDIGMRTDRVATARLSLPPARYSGRASLADFVERTLEHLEAMPGVRGTAAINTLPMAAEMGIRMRVQRADTVDTPPTEAPVGAPYLVVSPGYFETMGIPLLQGRDVAWTDSNAFPVAVVNRTAAERLWPGEEPVGKRVVYGRMAARTVVGVVGDARISQLNADAGAQIYLPIQDQPQSYLSLVARGAASDDVAPLLARIRDAVHATDPTLPLYAALPMDDVVSGTVVPRRVNTVLIGTFAAIALCLAIIGVYGVLAYSVAQRTREIGIRMAIGAQRAAILALVVRQGLVLVGIGTALGVAAALATTRYLESMLYGVTPRDPATLVAVVLLFAATAVLASYVPARRASTVDPLDALRHD